MESTLYYIHDPMCSWCWGFRPTWDALQEHLPAQLKVEYVAGGLAPDTDEPMPLELQETIQGYWRKIQNTLGTEFNFDFWAENTPRRSTYNSCRAAIAAKKQGAEAKMVDAIQRAYYLRALNPSDTGILNQLASELGPGFDAKQFSVDLLSKETQQQLDQQIQLARELTDQGFPSLVLEQNGKRRAIVRNYVDYKAALTDIMATV